MNRVGLRMGSTFWAVDLARVGAATVVLAAERAVAKASPELPDPFQLAICRLREFSMGRLLQVVDPSVEICV